MPRSFSRIAAVAMFLLGATAISPTLCLGDDLPTLDQLIEATPNIDTSDPETKSFRFTVELDTPVHCFETTIAWKRDEMVGMRTMLGKNRIPGWLISGEQYQLFDVCNGRLINLPASYPSFVLRQSGRSLQIEHGFKEKYEDTNPIVLNLKSMIHETRERAQVSRAMDGRIQIFVLATNADPTKEDQGGLLAVYAPEAPHKLHRLQLLTGDNLPPLLSVYDVSVNDETDAQWPSAPTEDQLPQDVTILDRSDSGNRGILQTADIGLAMARAHLIHFAIEDEEQRSQPAFLGVNWDKTLKFATEAGPEVERLWR